jgi:GWxTD domain-containing protein
MKKFIISILVVSLCSFSYGKDIKALLSYASFVSPVDGPYLETYLSVDGESAVFVQQENGTFQACIEITLIFKDKNDDVVDFKKYNLFSPEIEDTTNIDFTFIDQQRFALGNGYFNLEISIDDLNSTTEPLKVVEPVELYYKEDEISISGIQLIESYSKSEEESIITKSGYDLIPYSTNFYPSYVNNLTYYCEIYNTKKLLGEEGRLLVKSYIESYETAKQISDKQSFKRENTKEVIIVFNEFNIENLPSGNYYLVIEVRNPSNELVSKNKLFFQKSNPDVEYQFSDINAIDINNTFASQIAGIDTLSEFIESLRPISSEKEKEYAENQLEMNDLEMMQKYFYHFWHTRNNEDPEQEWMDYFVEVLKVNKEYGTSIQKGYETDRGRVYLEYGAPNTIVVNDHEPSAYPYEIWHYYAVMNGREGKFIFYCPDLVTNIYELLHSDVIGEIQNRNWQLELHKRNEISNDPDENNSSHGWGSNSNEYYNNPR